jgi:uncharacterized protein (DUF488 family)
MIKLYTIGFTGKSAEQFFTLLQNSKVQRLVDTRINNVSQLAGYAKAADLAFFTKTIAHADYMHNIDFAPTKDLLADYRNKKLTWTAYENEYFNLLDRRKIANKINIEELHQNCLLCSEHTPEKCHRRLLAEFLQQRFGGIDVVHLI